MRLDRDIYTERFLQGGDSPWAVGYLNARWFYFERDVALGMVDRGARRRILDAGCGTGVFVQPLIGRDEVFGIDLLAYGAMAARRRGLMNCRGDIFQLPFCSGSFDVILCVEVMQHFPPCEGESAFKEFRRVLKPEGQLVMAVRNGESLVRSISKHFARRITKTNIDLFGYTLKDMVDRLTRNGFRVDSMKLIFPPLRLTSSSSRRMQTWLFSRLATSIIITAGG